MAPFLNFFQFRQVPSAQTPELPSRSAIEVAPRMDFDGLCHELEQRLHDLNTLQTANEKAVNRIADLQDQLGSASRSLAELRRVLQAKDKEGAEKNRQISNLSAQLRNSRTDTNKEKLARIHQTVQSLDYQERAVESEIALRAHKQFVKPQESIDSMPDSILPSHPFVVLLVDGDSYYFAKDLLKGPRRGVQAAERLRTAILKYMIDHQEIPMHSKILVRVFFNGRQLLGPRVQNNARQYSEIEEFMVRFSETQPLFDFMDCGGGKERADSKIKENFSLYVSHPNCSAMFLALCFDNGFVRMLEPYQGNEIALRKIVLVKAGESAPEFQGLPFKTVEFPSVFQEQVWRVSSRKDGLKRVMSSKPADSQPILPLSKIEPDVARLLQILPGEQPEQYEKWLAALEREKRLRISRLHDLTIRFGEKYAFNPLLRESIIIPVEVESKETPISSRPTMVRSASSTMGLSYGLSARLAPRRPPGVVAASAGAIVPVPSSASNAAFKTFRQTRSTGVPLQVDVGKISVVMKVRDLQRLIAEKTNATPGIEDEMILEAHLAQIEDLKVELGGLEPKLFQSTTAWEEAVLRNQLEAEMLQTVISIATPVAAKISEVD